MGKRALWNALRIACPDSALVRAAVRSFEPARKFLCDALAQACEDWNDPLAAVCLMLGADPNAPSKINGQIPLCARVARSGNAAALALLLKAGADPAAGMKPGDFMPVHQAALKGKTDCARLLIRAGADRDAKAGNGWSPLICACRERHPDTVRALLELGASPSDSDENGNSAVAICAERGCAEGIRALALAGAGLDERNRRGFAPAHLAALHGRIEACRELFALGADFEAQCYGKTPLSCARSRMEHETAAAIEALLLHKASAGASQGRQDGAGKKAPRL